MNHSPPLSAASSNPRLTPIAPDFDLLQECIGIAVERVGEKPALRSRRHPGPRRQRATAWASGVASAAAMA